MRDHKHHIINHNHARNLLLLALLIAQLLHHLLLILDHLAHHSNQNQIEPDHRHKKNNIIHDITRQLSHIDQATPQRIVVLFPEQQTPEIVVRLGRKIAFLERAVVKLVYAVVKQLEGAQKRSERQQNQSVHLKIEPSQTAKTRTRLVLHENEPAQANAQIGHVAACFNSVAGEFDDDYSKPLSRSGGMQRRAEEAVRGALVDQPEEYDCGVDDVED